MKVLKTTLQRGASLEPGDTVGKADYEVELAVHSLWDTLEIAYLEFEVVIALAVFLPRLIDHRTGAVVADCTDPAPGKEH